MRLEWIAFVLLCSLFVVSAGAQQVCPPRVSSPLTDEDFNLPECLPQQAANALKVAQKWQSDSVLIRLEVTDRTRTGRFDVRFSFYSPSHGTGLWVIGNKSTPTGLVNWGSKPIPRNFLDLYPAVKKAREQGMDTPFDQAVLFAWPRGIAWSITPVDDPDLRTFEISAIQNSEEGKQQGSWQTSWNEFAKEIQRRISASPSRTDFDYFIAKRVTWEGKALTRSKYRQPSVTVNLITIRMPEANVSLPDGSTLELQNPIQLVSDFTDDTGSDTTITYINQQVRFHATILDVHTFENKVILQLVDGKIEEYR